MSSRPTRWPQVRQREFPGCASGSSQGESFTMAPMHRASATPVRCICTPCSAWRATLQQLIGLISDEMPERGIPDPSPMRERKRAYADYLRQAQQRKAS